MPILSGLVRAASTAYALSGLGETIRASAGRIALASLCATVTAICAIAAMTCAIFALWIFALPYVGPVGAPLLAAGVLVIISIALLAVARSVLRRPRRRSHPSVAPELMIAEATRLLREHKGAVLLAALVAGLIAGNDRRDR